MTNVESIDNHPFKMAQADLARSGLNHADYKRLGISILKPAETAEVTGKYRVQAMKFPYFDTQGRELDFFRLKFLEDVKAGKAKKPIRYWQPPDTIPRAYFPPCIKWSEVLADPTKDIWITEGEKKAAKACKEGIPTIGLSGVWAWKSTKLKTPLIPDLNTITWTKRQVRLCFDTDAEDKPEVTGALEAMGHVLANKSALVQLVRLPLLDEAAGKTGLDDFLVAKAGKNGTAKRALLAIEPEVMASASVLLKLNDEIAIIDSPSCLLRFKTGDTFTDIKRFATTHYGTHKVPVIDAAGRMGETNAVAEWLKWPAHRIHNRIVFEPGEPQITADNNYNLWKGWPVAPKKGDVTLFNELLDYQFAGCPAEHRKWFVQWLAYPIQNPGAKLYSAVIFWSKDQGTGKSLLGLTIGQVYGESFESITEAELHSQFNDWQVGRQFILGEEITGSDRLAETNKLKYMVTSETVRVNKKYQAPYTVRNCANFMFNSNHPDSFTLDDRDRRYFVHEVGKGAEKPSRAWFRKYDAWYRTEAAIAAMHWHLAHMDLTGFDPRDPAPQTTARIEMVNASGTEADFIVRALLENPDQFIKISETVSCARDLFTLEELTRTLDPDRRYGLRNNQLYRALRKAGISPLDRTCIKAGYNLRLWPVRNIEKWVKAKHAERVEHYKAFTSVTESEPSKF
jgi:hypothetical protein